MEPLEKHRRAEEACLRCEQELNKLLQANAESRRELEAFTRALCLLRARARALAARAEQGAMS